MKSNTRQTIRAITIALAMLTAHWVSAQSLITVSTTTHNSCQNDGSVKVHAAGGTGVYSYTLYNHNGYQKTQTTDSFSHLAPSYYFLSVTDSISTAYDSIQIFGTVSDSLSVSPGACPSPGIAQAFASGGTPPYTYLWNPAGTGDSVHVHATTYAGLKVTDHNGCYVYDSVYIPVNSPDTITISTVGSSCSGTRLMATVTGGAGPYTYHWNNGSAHDTMNTNGVSGYYYVTVTDGGGCQGTAYYYYQSGGNSYLDTTLATYVYPTCKTTGSINPNANYGTAPYHYHWNTGDTTATIHNVTANTGYQVTITDASGCTKYGYYYIYNGIQLTSYIKSQINPGCGQSNGTINIYAYNTTGTVTYKWYDGANNLLPYTTAVVPTLPAGSYKIVVADTGGCSDTLRTSLYGQGAFHGTVTTTPTACDTALHTGTATVIVSGTGVAPYTFLWQDGNSYHWNGSQYIYDSIGHTQSVGGLHRGTIPYVQITDATGCSVFVQDSQAYIAFDPSCYNHITGTVFTDLNSNCIQNTGDIGVPNNYVTAYGTGGYYYGTTDSLGHYDIQVLAGTYTINHYTYSYNGCVNANCPHTDTVTFIGTGHTSASHNFSLGAPSFDLSVHPGFSGSAPGQEKRFWVYYFNNGTTATPATITFAYDDSLTLDSVHPAYTTHNAATHTITWNIASVSAGYGWNSVRMSFKIPTTLTLGSYLTCTSHISPTVGDCDSSDNTVTITDMVSGSHDPNEKEVSPSGNLTASDTVLNYTVRFQNNGNAPANYIQIRDTLSPNVNPASIQLGASSAPCVMNLSGKGNLTFTFYDINLPDSVHDEPHSHGFVNYSVHTKPNLPIGTLVKNTASIYFDLNSPVVTNTTVSLRSNVTGIPVISGTSDMRVLVSPNPVQDAATISISGATGAVTFTVTDINGALISRSFMDNGQLTFRADNVSSGLYFFTAQDARGHQAAGKISVVK